MNNQCMATTIPGFIDIDANMLAKTISKETIKTLITEIVYYYCVSPGFEKTTIEHMLETDSKTGKWQLDHEVSHQAAIRVVDYFQLDVTFGTAVLMKTCNIDLWSKICLEQLINRAEGINFCHPEQVAGDSLNFHSLEDLWQEAYYWAEHFSHIEALVGTLPRHTRFGFIWTVLLPKILDINYEDVKNHFPPDFLAQPKHTLVLCGTDTLPVLSNSMQLKEHPVEVVVHSHQCERSLLQHAVNCGFDEAYHVYSASNELTIGYTKPCMNSYVMAPFINSNLGQLLKNGNPISFSQKIKIIENRFLPMVS